MAIHTKENHTPSAPIDASIFYPEEDGKPIAVSDSSQTNPLSDMANTWRTFQTRSRCLCLRRYTDVLRGGRPA